MMHDSREKEKQVYLQKLADFDAEDLLVALHAAEASRENRGEHGFYFLHHFLGEKQVEIAGYDASIQLPVNQLVLNPLNMLHGGVTALLCDNVMGLASFLDKKRPGVTLDLHIRYHQPIRGTHTTARAKVISSGGRINITTCEVVDETGKVMATATGSFYHKV
ncbi:PaaI family thioesterase [Sulfoacidibacillus thermotolerans]|uniref:Thioesterase domain-containing protein n=1 Tax=Sulfoacidibacillus thermotolerans TaxID=1765684 RepID=A0A2U3D8D3_SULT2|nr:PaaI family thioesterase [Sulfoacidibacillus thermotolerans]PWI57544.1 hypothetical protein BM613_07925 [Sulfoacidibacillus thermotolerans]